MAEVISLHERNPWRRFCTADLLDSVRAQESTGYPVPHTMTQELFYRDWLTIDLAEALSLDWQPPA